MPQPHNYTTKQANIQAILEKLAPYLQSIKTTGANFLNSPAGQQALGGGAIGAGLGGLYGLAAPGEDEYGNPRNRFGAMLRGALGGGALGAGAGGLLGHFAPDAVGQAKDYMRGAYYKAQGGARDAYHSHQANKIRKALGLSVPQADPETVPVTARGSLAGSTKGPATNDDMTSLLGKPMRGTSTSSLKAPQSPTYTPTAPGAGARRKALNDAEQAGKDMITGMTARRILSGEENPGLLAPYRTPAQIQQMRLDKEVGITNASPEMLRFKQQNPEGFARMMQQVREEQVQRNVEAAPSHGLDTSQMDFSNLKAPGSSTMGSPMQY